MILHVQDFQQISKVVLNVPRCPEISLHCILHILSHTKGWSLLLVHEHMQYIVLCTKHLARPISLHTIYVCKENLDVSEKASSRWESNPGHWLSAQVGNDVISETVSLAFPLVVSFWLNGTTYQNNSLVTLENIGEGDAALLCLTDQPACCRPPYTGSAIGNWYFPNGTLVPNTAIQWDFHRTRGQMMVLMHRRRGGVTGIYYCEIPDAMNVTQSIYIGVFTENTGEWYLYKW